MDRQEKLKLSYKEQLLDEEWKQMRHVILKRDEKKCQICFNERLSLTTEQGLVFGNSLENGPSPISESDNSYYLPIFNFREDIIDESLLSKRLLSPSRLDTSQSYVVYYTQEQVAFEHETVFRYVSLTALRALGTQKDKILSGNKLRVIDEGIKALVAVEINNEVYRKPTKADSWTLVLGHHIHHKYYKKGSLPWEYPTDALQTLCWQCHEELHRNGSVPCLDENGIETTKYHFCGRCHGAGIIPRYYYYRNGICFGCDGARYRELIVNPNFNSDQNSTD